MKKVQGNKKKELNNRAKKLREKGALAAAENLEKLATGEKTEPDNGGANILSAPAAGAKSSGEDLNPFE